jgi:hypothetical protein
VAVEAKIEALETVVAVAKDEAIAAADVVVVAVAGLKTPVAGTNSNYFPDGCFSCQRQRPSQWHD